METAVIVEILKLAATVGVPAVQAFMATWNKDQITLADVQALHNLVQSAESYFAAKGPFGPTTPATPAG
jgi:hypothetical protein